jgi:hypothetical protein
VGALAVVVAIVRHLQATDPLALVILLPIAGLQLCTGLGCVALIRHRRATDRHL